MKKLFTLFMLTVFALVLVGCKKEVDAPKTYTSAALELDVFELMDSYSKADNYGVKLTSNDGETTLVTEVKMNKLVDVIESMMYKQTGGENDMHVYVSDAMTYMLTEEGDKIKNAIGVSEQAAVLRDYGFDKFIEAVDALLLGEVELYSALPTSVEVVNKVATFVLDLGSYSGTFFTEATAVNFKITFEGSDMSALEIEVTKGEVVMSNKLEFFGTAVQTIALPTDLTSYVQQ